MRESQKIRYEYRKANHLCCQCGSRDARTLAGKTMCAACVESYNAARAYRRGKRFLKGQCTECGRTDERTRSGLRLCAKCADGRLKSYYAWARKKKDDVQ